ncbi:FDXHR family putative zinc-binding protein [Micromonospora sediminicola]
MIACRCGAAWSGASIAHCACCHRTFSAVSTFDKHRTGTVDRRRCVDPVTVGLAPNRHGVYRTPSA